MELFLSSCAVLVAWGISVFSLVYAPKWSRSVVAFALGMALAGGETLLAALSASALSVPEILAWQQWRLLIMALLPGVWLYFSLTFARGNASEFVARWGGVLLAAFLLPVGLVGFAWNEMLGGEPGVGPNSFRMLALERAGIVFHVLFAAGAILSLANLEATLRESRGVMRWRIKYRVVGVGFLLMVWFYNSIQAVLYSAINVDLAGLNAAALVLGCVFICTAMTRGNLSAVDLYPTHTGIQGGLTLIAAGVYLLLVGGLAELAAYLEASNFFPLQAFLVMVGIGGGASILLSDRLRQRTRRFISHHFHKPQYDYRHVWATFTERTASLSDPTEFCRAVTQLISDTFEALSVTIWLMDEHRQSLSPGASTSLSEDECRLLIGDEKMSPELVKMLREQAYPTAVLQVPGEPGKVLQKLGKKKFPNGGDYYFIPLMTRDEVLGVLILGDRVSGLPFTFEEFDLMKTLGNQIVANLLSIKLSGRLGEARKLEAFQTMSTFFVHDLKNMASTLSLMLQNLPRHFDDPDFRQDALKAISKSVDKINAMIGKLSYFRQNLEIKPVRMDLNGLIRNTVAGLAGVNPEQLTLELNPVPGLLIDPEQFQKVITNLVLNARDAIRADGRICIRTELIGGAVLMTVSDNGGGMTPEFLEQSVFRPFQTTKQDGFGIGLFHCKMIVTAHHGKIEVESQLGKGTTFRVSMPIPGEKK